VHSLTEKLAGRTPQRRIDLPVRLVTKDMLGQTEIQELVSPQLEK
jgi:hypothetical protein